MAGASPATRDQHTVSALFAYLLAGVLLLLVLFGVMVGHLWLWGDENVDFPWLLLLVFLPLTVAHELLHGLGFRLAGASWSEIQIGINWRRLTPYAHCRVAMRAGSYRLSVILPGLVLGVIPALIGLATGQFWLNVLGATMTGAAGGDLAVLWAIRAVDRSAMIADHPSKPGCIVIDPTGETTVEQ